MRFHSDDHRRLGVVCVVNRDVAVRFSISRRGRRRETVGRPFSNYAQQVPPLRRFSLQFLAYTV